MILNKKLLSCAKIPYIGMSNLNINSSGDIEKTCFSFVFINNNTNYLPPNMNSKTIQNMIYVFLNSKLKYFHIFL